jgi:hypothetical protein
MSILYCYALSVFCLLSSPTSSPDSFFITRVEGKVSLSQSETLLQANSYIKGSELSKLKFGSSAFLIIYNKTTGLIKYNEGKRIKLKNSKLSSLTFFLELGGFASEYVPLGSRGECECGSVRECFSSQLNLNSKILVARDEYQLRTPKNRIVFVQYSANDTVKTIYLPNAGDTTNLNFKVLRDTLNLKDTSAMKLSFGEAELINGKYLFSKIIDAKFIFIKPEQLKKDLSFMKNLDLTPTQLWETFYLHCYLSYGKPDECQLRKIFNSDI